MDKEDKAIKKRAKVVNKSNQKQVMTQQVPVSDYHT